MNTLRCNFMPQVMMAPDLDSAGGDGNADSGDDEQFSYNPDLNSDEMATTLDTVVDAPVHEYMNSDSDEEEADTQEEEVPVSNNDGDDDPNSGADDNSDDIEEDDSGDDDENKGDDDPQQGLSTATIRHAVRLGMTDEDIDFYHGQGEGVLERVMSRMPEPQAGDQQNGEQQQDTPEYKAPEAYAHELDDETDEDTLKTFNGLSEHVNGQMKQVHEFLGGLANIQQNYANDQLDAHVNELIDDLKDFKGAAFAGTLGAGTDGIVAPNSVADRNRQSVMREIGSIQAKRIANNQPPMTTKRAFNQAVKTVTGTDINSTNKKTVAKLGKRSQSNSLQNGRKSKDTKKSNKPLTTEEIIAIQKKNFSSLV